ncbi:MAG TPA: DUF1116 domain-containing protein [Acidimicrobiales bacterium]|jgi:hypothetical protein|nr:DUF1116 domain-containing protein [Acidimicrobiales bacterium]
MATGTGPVIELPDDIAVVNVGLGLFGDAVATQGRPVESVEWRIPAGGDREVVAALRRLYGPRAEQVEAANTEVLRRIDQSQPVLSAVRPAGEVIAGFGGRTLLHCGPSIDYARACDPLRRSLRAAAVAEGWASDIDGADQLLKAGDITLEPANPHDTVVPMVTAIGPTQPVLVVDNPQGANRAYCPLNQGPGETAWFGRETDAAIERLRFLRLVVGPVLQEVIQRSGPIDVFGLAAQGVQMGDDVHIRNQASSNLLIKTLLPALVALDDPRRIPVAEFLAANYLFFLNLAMAAARATTGWAMQVPDSSIVTTMARNGTDFGVRLAGSDDWFLAPAPPVGQAMYYAGFGPETSAADVGDSAVLELIGLGGPAAGASPSVAAFVGGTMTDAIATTEAADRICAGRSSRFKIPLLDFRGTPIGVDARRVVESGETPRVTTGILHASAGTGQVGAGVATAPVECFVAALLDLDRRLAAR